MIEIVKTCDTCGHSYPLWEFGCGGKPVLRQHCNSSDYNGASYTEWELLKDKDRGCCRFWKPKEINCTDAPECTSGAF